MNKIFNQTVHKIKELWNKLLEIEASTQQNSQQLTQLSTSLSEAWRVINAKKNTDTSEYVNVNSYLLEMSSDGVLMRDENGTLKISPIYNNTTAKSSVVWDVANKCWRFFAVYADDEA